jgi:hypothetical protein
VSRAIRSENSNHGKKQNLTLQSAEIISQGGSPRAAFFFQPPPAWPASAGKPFTVQGSKFGVRQKRKLKEIKKPRNFSVEIPRFSA